MSSKYYKAISNIEMDAKKKEEMIKLLKEKNNKGVIIMSKIRKVFTTLGAIAGIAICGGAAYAGITGKINLFNNKVDTEYQNYATVVENKFVENEYSKITLDNIACDDAYLILNYTIDIKEKGMPNFENIKLDSTTGFELNFSNTVNVDGKVVENYGNFSQEIARKITDKQAKVYQVVDLTNFSLPERFNVKLSNFNWWGNNSVDKDIGEVSLDNIIIKDSLSVDISKKDAVKNTKTIIPNNKNYNYQNLKLSVEQIVEAPFETFITVKTEESNIPNKYFPSTRDEAYYDLMLDVFDDNNNKVKTSIKSVANLMFKDGSYYKDEDGKIENINFGTPSEGYEGGTIFRYFVIATDNKIDNLKNITIKPYYNKFTDNGEFEEKHINSLKWYDVKNEKISIEDGKGGILTVQKVEVKDDRILFYYTVNELVTNPELYIKNKVRAFNYFYADIEPIETAPGEFVAGIRLKDNESASMYSYENGDTDETANPENYSNESYLSDISKLSYAFDLGTVFEVEELGNGITVELK